MAHFCETFNSEEDLILDVGFDEDWIAASGGFEVVSQRSQPHTCNFPNEAFRLPDLDGADMVGSITIVRLDPVPAIGMSFGINAVTINLRITSLISPRDYYGVQYVWSVFVPGDHYGVQIFKYVGNAFTQLGFVARTFTPGDRLKARIVGTTIQALVNDVEVLSVTDGSHTTSRTIGFGYFMDCATPFGGIITDNFFGGDVAEEDNLCPPGSSTPEPEEGERLISPGVPGNNIMLTASIL